MMNKNYVIKIPIFLFKSYSEIRQYNYCIEISIAILSAVDGEPLLKIGC